VFKEAVPIFWLNAPKNETQKIAGVSNLISNMHFRPMIFVALAGHLAGQISSPVFQPVEILFCRLHLLGTHC